MPGRKGPGSVSFVLDYLARTYPSAGVVLRYRTPFELLVATVLAAQCTDDRVNQVTPKLFARYPDATHLARADQGELEELIRSTGFSTNRSTHCSSASCSRTTIPEWSRC